MRPAAGGAAAALLLAALSPSASAPAAGAELRRDVAGAAATSAAGSGFRLRATLGQAASGRASGPGLEHHAGFWPSRITLATGADEGPGVPRLAWALGQNLPNPFSASTRIPFALAEETLVSLHVFDVAGRRVRTLHDGRMPAGRHEVVLDGRDLPSGVYFYRLRAGSFLRTKKLTLLR